MYSHEQRSRHGSTSSLQNIDAGNAFSFAQAGFTKRVASDYLPGKLKDKYKLSTQPPFFKKRGEQGTQESEQAQPEETQPVGATPLANDELILSIAPQYLNDESVGRFREPFTYILNRWGFTPQVDVKQKPILLGSEEKQALILKWNPDWGTKPTTIARFSAAPFDNANMLLIDASIAIAGVHQLEGWGKLDSTEQNILNNILGGETNAFSESMREELNERFHQLKAQNATEQESILRGLITGKNTPIPIPTAPEQSILGEKVTYHLLEVGEKRNYEFKGTTADAQEWFLRFDDSPGSISIFAAKAPDPKYHLNTPNQIADAASSLPQPTRLLFKEIVLNSVPNPDDAKRAVQHNIKDLSTPAVTDPKTGTVFLFARKEKSELHTGNQLENTLIHETGHIWSVNNWGIDPNKGKWLEWKKMMDADQASVSGYAKQDMHEDVGETVRIYVSTQGTLRFDEYRCIVPNRFAMLDREYNQRPSSPRNQPGPSSPRNQPSSETIYIDI